MPKDIQFVPLKDDEFNALFMCVKNAIYPYVDAVFGWDDDFQINRLKNEYDFSWFHWVEIEAQRVGMVCFKPYGNSYHLHLLIIFEPFQRQQLGKRVMNKIKLVAQSSHCESITLSSFNANTDALRFYCRLGYVVTEQDESFSSLRLALH